MHTPVIANFPVVIVPRIVLAGRITEQTATPQVSRQANASISWSMTVNGPPEKPLTGASTDNVADD